MQANAVCLSLTLLLCSMSLAAAEPDPVTFNDLLPAFQHSNCQNCHSVAADNFAFSGGADGIGLPMGHPMVNADTECMLCHSSFLATVNQVADIKRNWRPALATQQFAGKTPDELCQLAQTGTDTHDAAAHLSGDNLILWAVYMGGWTGHGDGMTAIEDWKNTVHAWAAAGMPCH